MSDEITWDDRKLAVIAIAVYFGALLVLAGIAVLAHSP